MRSTNLILKFLWFLSLFLVLAGLFYGYYLLPDVVCVKFSHTGSPLEYWERKYIFYVFAFTFVLFNVLLLATEKFFQLLPDSKKPLINRVFWLSSPETKEGIGLLISSWFYSFIFILNVSMLAVFGVVWKVNYDIQSNILQYTWLLWILIGLFASWIAYLPIRLSISKLFLN